MKKPVVIAFYFILLSLSNQIYAQTDQYTWDIKFGWVLPTFVNLGDTKEWINKGKGNELLLIALGYRNFHVNLSYKYFNDLQGKNPIIFGDYQFPEEAVYRNVFMNLTCSYEHEMKWRTFIEPEIGWVNTQITSNVIDNAGNEIKLDIVHGLIIGSNLIKYLKITDGLYVGFSLSLNYNFMNYQKISRDLKGNTLDYGYGFVLKGTN